ncbi:MAG: aminoacetone oxidase family FAD-binding enzyme [Cyanobacteria bacterium K_DeepCast_35m_m2_155]|nr:aminoacetone oxidase family FAD-binding enzyme [Cyanobacteria bacterium K_DeepCast_35m_m2_155]
MLPDQVSVLVAGGGASGFMAAIAAAEAGVADVHLLEATAEPLQKVRISGGGRCNVTHACWDPRALVVHYPRGNRALRGPFSRFATGDAVAWFDDHGLQLVEEADGRLFPRSNSSESVVATLRQAAQRAGVRVHTALALQQAHPIPAGFRCTLRAAADSPTKQHQLLCKRLVLATGGHPSGRHLAAALGHSIVTPVPSLFSLTLAEPSLRELAGVAMDPVDLRLTICGADGRSELHRQRGAVLITHQGLSGPALLRLTAFAARDLKQAGYRGELVVNWAAGLPPEQLDQQLDQLRQQQARRQLGSWRPWSSLSRRLWLHLLQASGIDPQGRWADLRRGQQQALLQALSASRYAVIGRGPFGEEFVTAGGVELGEINLATMESRCCPGLQIVGELLDVDGITGGFNFQHCWTSGWLAAQALAAATTLPGASI